MLKYNAKTILFISLIVAMILPFSSMNFVAADKTQAYDATKVSEAIKQITPYVTLDEDGLVVFLVDIDDIPIHPELVSIAADYIALQNSFIAQALENPNEKPTVDTEKFSEFIDDIQEKKSKSQETIDRLSGFDWILPEAFAWGEVCGGAPWNPQPEPPVYRLYNSEGAREYLLDSGYHLVAFYAIDPRYYGTDYGKEISAFGCNNGEMRIQGVVTGTYTYNSQSPEPNPELLNYTAPVWWWDGYVIAWHFAD